MKFYSEVCTSVQRRCSSKSLSNNSRNSCRSTNAPLFYCASLYVIWFPVTTACLSADKEE